MTGRVARLISEKGFGFITTGGSDDYFFHRDDCPEFDLIAVGDNVEFTEATTDKGLRAYNVGKSY